MATKKEMIDIVKLLLDHGAETSRKDKVNKLSLEKHRVDSMV